jgi:hypothetical protein
MATPPDVDSAKVSRSGAIWVAVITAVGGFATAMATGAFGLAGKSKPEPPVQRWLHINSVVLARDDALPKIDRIRLVAQVSGVNYAYPTSVHSLWAAVGPGMVGERYPLPVGVDPYRVRFLAFGYEADNKIPRYEYRGVQEFKARQVPIRSSQALQLTTSDPKGLKVGMTVHYSIE